jgi:hypothetical protein
MLQLHLHLDWSGVIQSKAQQHQGKANSAAGATSSTGTVGVLSGAVSTGIAQAQSRSAATAETGDGNAQALSGSLAVSGINAISQSTAKAIAETGDVSSTALSGAVGVFHGESRAKSTSATGCVDCVSDSVAQSVGCHWFHC